MQKTNTLSMREEFIQLLILHPELENRVRDILTSKTPPDDEIWRDVPGYEGLYQVSNKGRVKSLHTYHGKYQKILRASTSKGYQQVILLKNKVKCFFVHRLVAQAFIPNPENKPTVNHINGIKSDNRVENLEWADGYEQMRHAIDKGLLVNGCGENNPNSKLTNEQAEQIRKDYVKGSTIAGCYALAKKYDVSHSAIHLIVTNKSYKTDGE